MVWETKKIKTKEGKHLALKHSLKCTDYGIYGAKCRKCGDFYVGQTVNKFSVRWNGHRQAWENMINKKVKLDPNNLKDEQALYLHYRRKHQEVENGLKLWDAYKVVFLESPPKQDLDIAESYWIGKLDAGINLAKTCLPKIR